MNALANVQAMAATTATMAPSSPAEPPKGQVTFDLEINAHQPVNVLDVPGIDATFPLYLDIQASMHTSFLSTCNSQLNVTAACAILRHAAWHLECSV